MCVQPVYPRTPYIAGVRVCRQPACSRGAVCAPQECVINKIQWGGGAERGGGSPPRCLPTCSPRYFYQALNPARGSAEVVTQKKGETGFADLCRLGTVEPFHAVTLSSWQRSESLKGFFEGHVKYLDCVFF